MIVDPNGVAQALGSTVTSQIAGANAADAQQGMDGSDKTSLLVFRAGSPQLKAVPLSLVTRLEEIDTHKIEMSNGRHMIQYRDHLMPLVTIDEKVRVKSDGMQPLLVFSDGARSMALVVDEIVDIVEDRLDIQVSGDANGVLGSAVVRNQATEIIDVGHFLPLAFADWFRSSRERSGSVRQRKVLLIDDSPFFRNMLAPVLQAAGYAVTPVGSGQEALAILRSGGEYDVAVTDIEMPEMDGFAFAEAVRADEHLSGLPVIALSSVVSAEALERGRQVGLHDYVAKFDRQGLIASLKEQTDMGRAA
jgi:two-component system chemotaxis sensor kinase CheA